MYLGLAVALATWYNSSMCRYTAGKEVTTSRYQGYDR